MRIKADAIAILIICSIGLTSSDLSKIDFNKNFFQTQNVQAINTDSSYEDSSLQPYLSAIKSQEALKILKQKKEILVAVVDTGVDYNHPALKNTVLKDLGYNFIDNNNNTMDDNWHGTHVAGIIAAQPLKDANVSGATGTADVKIIPVKVLDKNGEGASDIIAKGIRYAADKGADIINFSVGFQVKDKYIEDAIKYAEEKGAFVVVSSGNEGSSCDNSSPAADNGAYTVSAVDMNNERSSFSNFGNSVKISAPGENILSTVPGGDYEYKSGTSMAAPIVAAVAALVKAENPSLTPQQIGNILDSTAVDIMEMGKDKDTGYGLVNAYEAVKLADKK